MIGQLTHIRTRALIELLESKGVISAAERRALLQAESIDKGREVEAAARENRGPPEWAGGADNNGNGGGPP